MIGGIYTSVAKYYSTILRYLDAFFITLAFVVLSTLHATADAVLPSTEVCRPFTSARSRDANCFQCRTGRLPASKTLDALVNKVRSQAAVFESIDQRINDKTTNDEVKALLRGGTLAKALYGSDAEFIFNGNASRCLVQDSPTAQASALEVPCHEIPRAGLGVIMTAGQSNSTSTGATDPKTKALYEPRHRFFNFNHRDGKCYVARNPLMGAHSSSENFAVRLGDDLIERGTYTSVLIVPVGIGGTYVEEWRPRGGKYFELLLNAIAGLDDHQFKPSAILWHHGEGNGLAIARHISEEGTRLQVTPATQEAVRLSYLRNLLEISQGLRVAGSTAPFYVAIASMCGAGEAPPIRDAQKQAPSMDSSIISGPDTDTLTGDMHADGCHMSHKGTNAHAAMWADTITRAIINDPKRPLVNDRH